MVAPMSRAATQNKGRLEAPNIMIVKKTGTLRLKTT
jgi:hypothetical protein